MIVKDLIPGMGTKAFAITESHENAARPAEIGISRALKRAGSLTADHQVINWRVLTMAKLHRHGPVGRQESRAAAPVASAAPRTPPAPHLAAHARRAAPMRHGAGPGPARPATADSRVPSQEPQPDITVLLEFSG